MTEVEKRAMRAALREEMGMSETPVQVRRPSPYMWMFAPRSIAMLGVALLVVLSTGSAYAAEGSLPGTPLYPVKTKIIEPLTVALAPTTQAKAQANADIAAVRVQEAQALAAQGALTPEAVQEISTNYNEHAQAALALAADVDTQNGTDETEASSTGSNNGSVTTHNPEDGPRVTVTTTVPAKETPEPNPSDDADDDTGTAVVTSTTLSVSVDTSHVDDSGMTPPTGSTTVHVQTVRTFVPPTPSVTASTSSTASNKTTVSKQIVLPVSFTRSTTTAGVTIRANATSSSFAGQLRATLSAQAEILQQLDAHVRSNRGKGGDN